jgi:hypothetical protein
MTSRSGRLLATALAVLMAFAPRSAALVSFDDGKQKIYLNAGATVTEDSNVFMSSEHRRDLIYGT